MQTKLEQLATSTNPSVSSATEAVALQIAVAEIVADARRDSDEYLKETESPYGGE
jgi:hypothetical protein